MPGGRGRIPTTKSEGLLEVRKCKGASTSLMRAGSIVLGNSYQGSAGWFLMCCRCRLTCPPPRFPVQKASASLDLVHTSRFLIPYLKNSLFVPGQLSNTANSLIGKKK